jgi:hypothetical protein
MKFTDVSLNYDEIIERHQFAFEDYLAERGQRDKSVIFMQSIQNSHCLDDWTDSQDTINHKYGSSLVRLDKLYMKKRQKLEVAQKEKIGQLLRQFEIEERKEMKKEFGRGIIFGIIVGHGLFVCTMLMKKLL